MPWDEQAFQARIMARARARGINSPRELMRKAGVSENTFDKVPGAMGRSYNTIEAIAGAVEWSVAEAIGQGLSDVALQHAVEVALKAVGQHEPELLPTAILTGYDVLEAVLAEGRTIDQTALSILEASLRQRRRR